MWRTRPSAANPIRPKDAKDHPFGWALSEGIPYAFCVLAGRGRAGVRGGLPRRASRQVDVRVARTGDPLPVFVGVGGPRRDRSWLLACYLTCSLRAGRFADLVTVCRRALARPSCDHLFSPEDRRSTTKAVMRSEE